MKKLLIILLLLGILVFMFAPQTLAYTLGGYINNSNRLFPYMNKYSNENISPHHQSKFGKAHRNQGFNFCLENGTWR